MTPQVRFSNRTEAGRRLAAQIAGLRLKNTVVYALPRGGVPVAVEIAKAVHAPLDLALVRKIGAPRNPEVAVAAVADYHVVGAKAQKMKRGDGNLTIELAPNPDILAEVARLPKGPFCVGFAAETEKLREHAQAKRKKKKIPLLAANLAQHAFGQDDNALTLFDDKGVHELARAPKLVLARQLVAHIAGLMKRWPRAAADNNSSAVVRLSTI